MYELKCLEMPKHTGYCLQCISCWNINSDSCWISKVDSCPDGNVCASRYQISTIGNVIFQNFKRFCAQLSECKVTGVYNKPSGSLEKMATTCCSEDRCTPAKPIVPDGSSQSNGLKCPTCSMLSQSCETLDCMGDETMCLLVTTKQTTGSLTLTNINQGCVSEGLCYQKNESSMDGEVYKETTYSCTQATSTGGASYTSSAKTVYLSVPSIIVLLILYNVCIF